jgi:hypothetical protein
MNLTGRFVHALSYAIGVLLYGVGPPACQPKALTTWRKQLPLQANLIAVSLQSN